MTAFTVQGHPVTAEQRDSSAVLSPCGLYRYRLERSCLGGSRTACIVMVNPSTADASADDATIRKLRGFAERNDIGRIIVVNKLAYRATDVRDVANALDPIGPDNDRHIEQAVRDADLVIVAWGPVGKLPPYLRRRWIEVVAIVQRHRTAIHCIGVAQCGHPRHPLMTSYATPITEWMRP